MERVLWFFLVGLLAVDVTLLVQNRKLTSSAQDLRTKSEAALLKTAYADEEEALLTGPGIVPATFPRLRAEGAASDTVQFVLLVSVEDCTNCIEDEVMKLNQIAVQGPQRITGIQGFFVDEDRPEIAKRFIAHLSPRPAFPLSVRNALSHLPGATTPLVLVLRSRDGKILDAHKPIPEDLTKRDAFYARWAAALGMS